jgi:hypothetical protein
MRSRDALSSDPTATSFATNFREVCIGGGILLHGGTAPPHRSALQATSEAQVFTTVILDTNVQARAAHTKASKDLQNLLVE